MLMKIFGLFTLVNSVFASEVQEPLGRPVMVGGQRDENNCLAGAGYNWCEASQSCVRHWVTPCADNYDDCSDCHKKQRNGENIACPSNCVNERDTSECSNADYIWCPTMNKCIDPKKEYCHRQSMPVIMEPDVTPIPLFTSDDDRQAPHLLLTSTGHGGIDTPPLIPPPPPNTCPIPYEDCDGEFVCPKVTEITRCSEGGIDGYTTYQLSLIIKNPNVLNMYAIFGSLEERNSAMSIPPAYQTSGIFGSNIGGVPQDIIDIHPDSRFDSWLTIGLTDGDPHDQLANIGVPFELWNEGTPLVVDDGAVFIMDPNEIITAGDEYVVAQLTLPSSARERVVINVQGQTICVDCGDRRQTAAQTRWTQYNVNFELKPPEPTDPNTIPADCKLWYDGCNTCAVLNGVLRRCTHTMCIREDNPHCLDFDGEGH